MNTHGGTLLVGVDDHGQPVGIESDYPFVKGQNRDGWGLWLTATVKNGLGTLAVTDMLATILRILQPDRRSYRSPSRHGTGICIEKGRG